MSFSDFNAWGVFNLVAVLLLSLLAANLLKKSIGFLQRSLIPTSVLGGLILLVISYVYELVVGKNVFNEAFFGGNGAEILEIITYHCLALGFIATSFKNEKITFSRKRNGEIFNTGVTTVATYLLQGVLGLGITLIASFLLKDFFASAGILLPFGYGQGTGQALNYGGIYQSEYGFVGGRNFGLTIAALGFLSASIGGVIYLHILRKKGKISVRTQDESKLTTENVQGNNEIPMNGSIDKFTVQIAIICSCYLLAFLIIYALAAVLPSFASVLFGFNFLFGVIAATIVKNALYLLKKNNIVKKEYVNPFLMTRLSGFFFDVMIVAGVAAIRISALKTYWPIIIILAVVGLVATFLYNNFVAKKLFPEYADEQFLAMFGMLTGTASTGIILLREIDPDFSAPAADNLVYQNFPAIVFGFPMMLLATFAPGNELFTLIIMVLFFIAMNILLFRKSIFGQKGKKNQPEKE